MADKPRFYNSGKNNPQGQGEISRKQSNGQEESKWVAKTQPAAPAESLTSLNPNAQEFRRGFAPSGSKSFAFPR